MFREAHHSGEARRIIPKEAFADGSRFTAALRDFSLRLAGIYGFFQKSLDKAKKNAYTLFYGTSHPENRYSENGAYAASARVGPKWYRPSRIYCASI